MDPEGEMYCRNLVECFVFSMNSGVRAGGGIGDYLGARRWGQPMHMRRVMFDFTFFVVVIICLLNIVFGIIIDTFAELRDARHKIEEDTKARCFICGIASSTFDRLVEGGFREHVQVLRGRAAGASRGSGAGGGSGLADRGERDPVEVMRVLDDTSDIGTCPL